MTEAVAVECELDSSERNLYAHFLQHRNSLKMHKKYGTITIIVQSISFKMQIALFVYINMHKVANIAQYINLLP